MKLDRNHPDRFDNNETIEAMKALWDGEDVFVPRAILVQVHRLMRDGDAALVELEEHGEDMGRGFFNLLREASREDAIEKVKAIQEGNHSPVLAHVLAATNAVDRIKRDDESLVARNMRKSAAAILHDLRRHIESGRT